MRHNAPLTQPTVLPILSDHLLLAVNDNLASSAHELVSAVQGRYASAAKSSSPCCLWFIKGKCYFACLPTQN